MRQAITVVSDVTHVNELLDGSSVNQVHLMPSGGRLRLDLELTRACRELQTVVRRGFMTKAKTPWIKCRLSLGSITEATVERVADTGVASAPLLSCEAVPGGYTLVVINHDGLQLSLRLEQLDGHFVDVGNPIQSP